MNFNENDLWRDKTELLKLRLSKLPSAKVLLRLEFDTEDQVLLFFQRCRFVNYLNSENSFESVFMLIPDVVK